MDYSCGKFGDCSFSRFGSVMRTDTHIHTHRQTRMNVLLPRHSSAWVVCCARTVAVKLISGYSPEHKYCIDCVSDWMNNVTRNKRWTKTSAILSQWQYFGMHGCRGWIVFKIQFWRRSDIAIDRHDHSVVCRITTLHSQIRRGWSTALWCAIPFRACSAINWYHVDVAV